MGMNPRIGQGIATFLLLAAIALWIVSLFFPVREPSPYSLLITIIIPVHSFDLWDHVGP